MSFLPLGNTFDTNFPVKQSRNQTSAQSINTQCFHVKYFFLDKQKYRYCCMKTSAKIVLILFKGEISTVSRTKVYRKAKQ